MWMPDPFEEFDDMFNWFLRPKHRMLQHRKGQELENYRNPVTDIYEKDGNVIATMEMPGIDKKDIDINITNDRLEVKAEQKHEKKQEDKKKGYYRYESRCKSYYRTMQLPAEVESEQAEASYKDGVLEIKMPKKEQLEQEKRKKIEVK